MSLVYKHTHKRESVLKNLLFELSRDSAEMGRNVETRNTAIMRQDSSRI